MFSRPAPLFLLLALPGLALAGLAVSHWLPAASPLAAVVVWDSLLPRIAMALLCGGALGLSGGLAQVALRNPLASPGTLGVSAGAALALSAASLYAPGLLTLLGREGIAFLGGTAGIGIVLALTVRGGLDPATVALAGLAVGLYAGSVAAVLAVLHTRQLAGLFVWNAGSLTQLGWTGAGTVAAVLALGAAVTLGLARPLATLALPDAMGRGLGVPVAAVRTTALAVSVGLAAVVVGQVGVIGFVGLAAPALARGTGSRRATLLWSSLLGAGLLLLTDQVAQALSGANGALLPTGAFTALAGAPLLLWLLPRVAAQTARPASAPTIRRTGAATPVLAALTGATVVAAVVALWAGRTHAGWAWGGDMLAERAPRVAVAAAAGVLLALAGLLFQRVLGNPLASPEVLGLGTGAMAGGGAALFLGFGSFLARLGFGAAGAATVLALLLLFARGRGFSTAAVLAGIALSAAGEAGLALVLATGDPAAETILLWSAGSTYGTAPDTAALAIALLLAALLLAAAAHRWLELLPLGSTVAGALGLPVRRARTLLLALGTGLTATGAMLAGPLSFVGLVAPHVARLLGLHRIGPQMAASALAGAGIMVVADWLGRTMLFPSEIPAGLLAALLGGPVLLSVLWRDRA